MPRFSQYSLEKLKTCDPRLQSIFMEVIKIMDCTVICGHRSQEAQDRAYFVGNSKLKWPQSKHNTTPSLAVDVAPYNKGIDWYNFAPFRKLAEIVKAEALKQNVKIIWGGDWKSFPDYPHYEIDE